MDVTEDTENEEEKKPEDFDNNKPVEAVEEQPKQEETDNNSTTEKSVDVTEDKPKRSSSSKRSSKSVKNEKTSDKEEIHEMAIFGKSDKKVMNLENGFMTYFNNAVKKYNKNLWLDGATELQKFARAYLDAIAIKENVSASKGQSRYNDIIDALKTASLISEQDEVFLKSCLGKQNYMQMAIVQPRLNTSYNYIAEYQLRYYPEWCATLKEQPSDPDVATA